MSLMTAPRTVLRDAASECLTHATARKAPTGTYLDPLDADEPSDDVVVTTRRAISRVALVATETAARFQRDGVAHDPMTWMMAPRQLFEGSSAIDACLARDACMRGILVHGLSLGLDVDPAEVDALIEEDVEDVDDLADVANGDRGRDAGQPRGADPGRPAGGPRRDDLRLFTATVVADDGFEVVQAFHASLAVEEAEIAGRLYIRMGAAMADAVIVEGFNPSAPLVGALVSPALCETLALVAADPTSPLAAGLDLNVEQRFLT